MIVKTKYKFLGMLIYTDDTLKSYTGYDIMLVPQLPDNWAQMTYNEQNDYLSVHGAIIKNIKVDE